MVVAAILYYGGNKAFKNFTHRRRVGGAPDRPSLGEWVDVPGWTRS
jgi:hypothetical protein